MKISGFPYDIRVFLLWSKKKLKKKSSILSVDKTLLQCQYLYRENFREDLNSRSVEQIRHQFRRLPFFLHTHIHTSEFQGCFKNNSFSNKSLNLLPSLNPSSLVHTAAHFPHSCTGKNIFLSTSTPSALMCKLTVYITKKKQILTSYFSMQCHWETTQMLKPLPPSYNSRPPANLLSWLIGNFLVFQLAWTAG